MLGLLTVFAIFVGFIVLLVMMLMGKMESDRLIFWALFFCFFGTWTDLFWRWFLSSMGLVDKSWEKLSVEQQLDSRPDRVVWGVWIALWVIFYFAGMHKGVACLVAYSLAYTPWLFLIAWSHESNKP